MTGLARYAAGFTWAESAYMGIESLSAQDVVLGDPLMAPFAKHPSVSFVAPTPDDGSSVSGPVELSVSAAPDGAGQIESVSYFTKDANGVYRLCGTVYQAPWLYTWDTTQWTDGDYTLEADVEQGGDRAGTTSIIQQITVANATNPTVTIAQPTTDYATVTESTPVVADVSGSVTGVHVQFWLLSDGDPIEAGDEPSPYSCCISSSDAPDGVYDLQAVVIDDSNGTVSCSVKRRIILANDHAVCSSLAAVAAQSDGSSLILVGVPVVAASGPTMDGMFYVEDSNRVAGIQVQGLQTLSTGRLAIVQGTLQRDSSIGERFIDALQVWDIGAANAIAPIAMTNRALGGKPPAGWPGITGGIGLYNLGLLVKTSGIVTYVGPDFFYIDDGNCLRDGNTLAGPYPVPPDGTIPDPVPYDPPTGVYVYMDSLTCPGIGDYVEVTGMSSAVGQGGVGYVRALRPRSQSDIQYGVQYTRCSGGTDDQSDYLLVKYSDPAAEVSPGTPVRLVDAEVHTNLGGAVWVFTDQLGGMQYVNPVFATTQLAADQIITVSGTAVWDEGDGAMGVSVDNIGHIYLGGSQYEACGRSLEPAHAASVDSAAGPFGPVVPSPGEILTSEAFIAQDSQPGCIGWALAQPDGTVVDLRGENITSISDGGHTLALRESYEPEMDAPRLIVQFAGAAPELVPWNQVDVVGTLTTLSNGQRAIVYPSAVYRWDSENGMPVILMPKSYNEDGTPEPWPSRTQVYPQ